MPLIPDQSALLFINVQKFGAEREGVEFKHPAHASFEDSHGWFSREIATGALPNMRALRAGCRAVGIDVLFDTIESGHDHSPDYNHSPDYKITGFNVAKGSWGGKLIEAIASDEDEIVLPKSCFSVFVSTRSDDVLRTLGLRQVVMSGLVTDQCAESAIRDACDLDYLVAEVGAPASSIRWTGMRTRSAQSRAVPER